MQRRPIVGNLPHCLQCADESRLFSCVMCFSLMRVLSTQRCKRAAPHFLLTVTNRSRNRSSTGMADNQLRTA
jgi:hypothetical protein